VVSGSPFDGGTEENDQEGIQTIGSFEAGEVEVARTARVYRQPAREVSRASSADLRRDLPTDWKLDVDP